METRVRIMEMLTAFGMGLLFGSCGSALISTADRESLSPAQSLSKGWAVMEVRISTNQHIPDDGKAWHKRMIIEPLFYGDSTTTLRNDSVMEAWAKMIAGDGLGWGEQICYLAIKKNGTEMTYEQAFEMYEQLVETNNLNSTFNTIDPDFLEGNEMFSDPTKVFVQTQREYPFHVFSYQLRKKASFGLIVSKGLLSLE